MRAIPRALVLFSALAVAGLLASPALSGECLSASVPGTLLMPDGGVYEAESIRVCSIQSFAPGTTLHRASVNGDFVGMFYGREDEAAASLLGETSRAYFVFQRGENGALELEGFAYPSAGSVKYFKAQSIRSTPRVVARDQFAANRPAAEVSTILVAAVTH